MSRRVAVFDLVLLLQIPPSRISLVHRCVSEGECETVFCIRFAETGRGFADKRKGHVTAQRDYHKERQEEGARKKKTGGTKDLPGLSLYTSPVFPLTHGTQMKTDFKGEDEKHSLL